MRKLFISIFFLLTISNGSSAQSYQSVFGKDSTTWTIQWRNLSVNAYRNFFELSDTFAFSEYYKKVVANDFGATELLIREDTTTGKVWCRSIDANCGLPYFPEKLVTDFSLSLGDTFNINNSDIILVNSPDTLVIVDSVYYILGQKYIRFKSPPDSSLASHLTEPITFIEGIGPNYGLLWMRTDCSFYLDQYLLCVYKDTAKADYVNQRFNGNCAPDLSGVGDLVTNRIHTYPNPANGYIYVDGVSDLNTEYMITNVLGQQLQSGNLVQRTNTIDIGSLPNGYYEMTLYHSKSKTYLQKFIKIW